MRKILILLCCTVLLTGLLGCTPIPAGPPTEVTQPAETQQTETQIRATAYSLYSMEWNDMLVEADELQDMLVSQGYPADDMCIILREDGTGFMNFMGEETDIGYDDAAYWPADDPADRTEYTLDGNLFIIVQNETTYTFEH